MEKAVHKSKTKAGRKPGAERPATVKTGSKHTSPKVKGAVIGGKAARKDSTIAKPASAKTKSAVPLIAQASFLAPQSPLTDEQVGVIPGLPSEAEIEDAVGALSAQDGPRFATIRRLLAESLGSFAAARAWLVTPGDGFNGTPLDAIRDGKAALVLEVLQAQFSQSPPYA